MPTALTVYDGANLPLGAAGERFQRFAEMLLGDIDVRLPEIGVPIVI